MNCEEFEREGLGAPANGLAAAAAEAHAVACGRCAALRESWAAASEELCLLREASAADPAPARVEMRLRQELRTRRRQRLARRMAWATAATLGAAALWVLAVVIPGRWIPPKQPAPVKPRPAAAPVQTTDASELANFTALPGSFPLQGEDASLVRVRMQRGALSALGLPVNPERAGEWIQVEVIVAEDGQPEAVRLTE